MSSLDASMRKIGCVSDFIEGGSANDPIQMLSDYTGLAFYCHVCKDFRSKDVKAEPGCNCRAYLGHRYTTSEVKTCLSDLKVLNKSDFKGLLTWRDKMRADRRAARAAAESAGDDADSVGAASDDGGGGGAKKGDGEGEVDSADEEEQVQSEIERLRLRKVRERKRLKKKEREIDAKRRRRAAFGMDLNAIDVPDNDKIFSLATITNAGDLEAAREVDLDKVTDDQLMGGVDSDDDMEDGLGLRNGGGGGDSSDDDDDDGHDYTLESELDSAYNRYLSNTKDGMAKSGTKMAKRTKKLQKIKALEEAREDAEMVGNDAEAVSTDAKAYADMLQGPNDGDGDSDGEGSDDYDSDADGNVVRDGSDRVLKSQKRKEEDDASISDEEAPKEKNSKSKPPGCDPGTRFGRRRRRQAGQEAQNEATFVGY